MKSSQNVFHLGISNIILKVCRKTPQEKQKPFGLRKGERNTRKTERDMDRKEKGRKKAIETNIVHSGLYEI